MAGQGVSTVAVSAFVAVLLSSCLSSSTGFPAPYLLTDGEMPEPWQTWSLTADVAPKLKEPTNPGEFTKEALADMSGGSGIVAEEGWIHGLGVPGGNAYDTGISVVALRFSDAEAAGRFVSIVDECPGGSALLRDNEVVVMVIGNGAEVGPIVSALQGKTAGLTSACQEESAS